MAGLTTTGFTSKRLEDVRADLEADVKADAQFGADAKTGNDSVLGHLLGIVAIALAEAWEAAQALYDSFNPNNASGVALDNLCAVTGTTRTPATKTVATVTLSGTAGTVISAGRLVSNSTTSDTYVLTATVTLDGAGEGTGTVEAETAGAKTAAIGEIDTIKTPVAGWSSVTNAAAATPGQDAETDADLRLRRLAELQAAGRGTLGAMRARLLQLTQVQQAQVLTNRTASTDGDGLPPHSFRAIVYPTPTDAPALAQLIYETSPLGIESDGDVAYTVTDDQGYLQTVKYSVALPLTITVEATLTTDHNYPADGDAQVEAAITARWSQLIGEDVYQLPICAAIASVPGVVSASVSLGGLPAGNNITVNSGYIAVLGAITITS